MMISPSRRGIDRAFWPALLLLAVVVVVFEVTDWDLRLQDHFYDFGARRWRIDSEAPVPRLLFYTGPKALLILGGIIALVLAVGPARWRAAWQVPALGGRRDLLVIFATLATGPALIGFGKSVTDVFCPSDIRRYGGDAPHVTLCGSYPEGDHPERAGRCFPAGHASGGFALFALAGLARTRRGRALGLALGLLAGGLMGGYQMLKGAHYLSHTLFTLIFMGWVFLAWRRLLRATGPVVT